MEEKISLSTFAHRGLKESLQQAEAAKLQAEAKHTELLRDAARTEAELGEARLAMANALEEARAEKETREALQTELAALRERYSALKRRFVDAGKKVRARLAGGAFRWKSVGRPNNVWPAAVTVAYGAGVSIVQ